MKEQFPTCYDEARSTFSTPERPVKTPLNATPERQWLQASAVRDIIASHIQIALSSLNTVRMLRRVPDMPQNSQTGYIAQCVSGDARW
jgi:hypothetical protein